MDTEQAEVSDDVFDRAIAAALRGKMAERNLKHNAVAERAGIPTSTFVRYTAGTRAIPASKLVRIADAIGVEAGELIKAAQHILETAKQQ